MPGIAGPRTVGIGYLISFGTTGLSAITALGSNIQRLCKKFLAGDKAVKLLATSVGLLVLSLVAFKLGWLALDAAFAGLEPLKEFKTEIAHIQAILQLADSDMTQFADRAMEIGAAFGYASTEVAEGMKVLARAGFSTQEALAMIEPVTQAAIIGEMGVTEATESVIAAFRSFNMTLEESQYLVDMLAKGTTLFKLEMDDYGQAVGRFGASAQAADQELSEMIALLGTLTTRGLSASRSGTMIKMMLNKLRAPSSNARKEIERLGIAVYGSDGKMRSILDIFQELDAALVSQGGGVGAGRFFADMAESSMDEAQTLRTLFGQRALVGFDVANQGAANFNGTMLQGIDLVRQQAQEIANAEGFAGEYSATMMATWERQQDKLASAWEGVTMRITSGLHDFFLPALTWFAGVIEDLLGFFEDHPIWAKIIGLLLFILGLAFNVLAIALGIKGIQVFIQFLEEKKLVYAKLKESWAFKGMLYTMKGALYMLGAAAAILALLLIIKALFPKEKTGREIEEDAMFNNPDSVHYNATLTSTAAPGVASYAKGTYTVRQTEAAILHAGESVVPPGQNDYSPRTMSISETGDSYSGTKHINIENINVSTISHGSAAYDGKELWDNFLDEMRSSIERENALERSQVLGSAGYNYKQG